MFCGLLFVVSMDFILFRVREDVLLSFWFVSLGFCIGFDIVFLIVVFLESEIVWL